MAKFAPKKMVGSGDTAPSVRPQLNVDPIFDAISGTYIPGVNGEMILNGGMMNFVGIGGEGNTGKSTIMDSMCLRILSRHPSSYLSKLDTEGTYTTSRVRTLASRYSSLDEEDFDTGDGRYQLISSIEKDGDAWYEDLKQFMREKQKDKSQVGTTPFLDVKQTGKPVALKYFYPSLFEIDSLSEFQTGTLREKMDKNDIDDKELNTYYMQDALQKMKMVQEFGKVLPRAGCFVITTMHVDDTINVGVTPERKHLTYQRQGQKFKRVPKNVEFLTQHCWDIIKAAPLYNSDRTDVLYPESTDVVKGMQSSAKTDLLLVTFQGLRNKSGPSGLPVSIIVSQSSGVLWSLSHFHHLKSCLFGVTESGRSVNIAFYPDVNLQRTTLRSIIDSDARLRRALELQCEFSIMAAYRNEFPNKYRIVPATLKEMVEQRGYDWNKILDTRGYWLFEEEVDENTPQYLSGIDLCRIALGEYDIPQLKTK